MNEKSKTAVKYGIAILIILIVAMAINDHLMTNWRNEYDYAEYQYNYYKDFSGDSYIRGQMMASYGNQMNELSSQIELSETIQGYMPIGIAASIIIIVIGIILGIKDYSSLGKKKE